MCRMHLCQQYTDNTKTMTNAIYPLFYPGKCLNPVTRCQQPGKPYRPPCGEVPYRVPYLIRYVPGRCTGNFAALSGNYCGAPHPCRSPTCQNCCLRKANAIKRCTMYGVHGVVQCSRATIWHVLFCPRNLNRGARRGGALEHLS